MRYRNNTLPNKIAVVLILGAIQTLVTPIPVFAQDEGLTFEQAQIRTTHARRQMESTRRALAEAEAREEEWLGQLAILRKRLEEARLRADKATEERETAEKAHAQAQENWSVESERLKRIHRRRDSGNSGR